MKKHIITLLATSLCCSMTFAQFGGFDFGGGGGAGSGSLSSYTNKQNIDYVGDNHVGHKLDIYYPNDGKATHNVIIHIYGSAWGSNDSKGSADHGTVGKAALEAGYIFVTPNHRTYNDALWPAQINDIKAVVRYLRGNKEELKIDDSFIGISGFSSGGHLASMMGVTNGEKVVNIGSVSIDIEGNLGKFTNESSSVDAVCDWSGPVDCRDKGCGNPINMSPENDMVGGCTPQQCPDKHASLGTNTYIDANDVPHMICHGTTDNIVPSCEGEKYKNNLKDAGIYVEWYNPGHGHQVNGDYTDEMIKFFNKIRSEKGDQGGGQQGGGDQGGGQQGGGDQGGSTTTSPYDGTAASVPGKIECELYDEGGSGKAYNDADTKNQGDVSFRSTEEVDLVKAGDGIAVGYTTTDEWLVYTIDVKEDGDYYVGANMSNGSGNPVITLFVDDKKAASITGSGVSNDWDTYAMGVASSKITLSAGTHVMKMEVGAKNTNIDYILISKEEIKASNPGGGSQGGGHPADNACGDFPALSGNGTAISGNTIKNIGKNGFNVEQWYQGGNNSMTVYPDQDCAFKCSWNGTSDYLARVGYMWGQNSGKTYKSLAGDIHAEFNFTMSGSGGGYSYIGIYGWTVATMVEYYIVENSFAYGQGGMYYGANKVGTYTVDGDTYTLYKGMRYNAPNITGKDQDFPQIFAARGDGGRGGARNCGHINVSEHFRQWAKLGVKEIETGQLYDCKLLCEAGGGQGSFEMRYGTMWIGELANVEEFNNEKVNNIVLTPNPAESFVTIRCNEDIEKVELINAIGQVVSSQNNTNLLELSVPSGIYFVKVCTASGEVYVERLAVK